MKYLNLTINIYIGYSYIGYRPIKRRHLDRARFWTMVYKRPFRHGGYVRSIQYYAGTNKRRRLRVGIFKPVGGNKYRLVRQISFRNRRIGLNTVR